MEVLSLIQALIDDRCIPRWVRANLVVVESAAEQRNMNATIVLSRNDHFAKRGIKLINANMVAMLCSDSLRLPNGKALAMDIVVNLSTRDVLPKFSGLESIPASICNETLNFAGLNNIWLATYDDEECLCNLNNHEWLHSMHGRHHKVCKRVS